MIIAIVAAALALAAQPALPDWNERQVLKLVTDSPWAQRMTVPLRWKKQERRALLPREIPGADPVHERTGGGLGPLGGIGAPPKDHLPHKADLILRWASALPVRQAKAIYTKNPAGIAEFGNQRTLEIFGLPAEIAHLGAESVEALALSNIVLRTKSGKTIKPNGADARVHGSGLTLFVHFPKSEPLTKDDSFIQIDGDMQIFRFTARFLLKNMEYSGALEL